MVSSQTKSSLPWVIVAVANQPDRNLIVITRESCREIVQRNPAKFIFDEETGYLSTLLSAEELSFFDFGPYVRTFIDSP